ncbi:MAG: hypothetical protein Q8L48_34060 [Archangium sp.]|nr:hypothetical protein [Archangium sp.]
MNEALTTQAAAQLVPASYAEKAMASLMQLHSELMDEKEKRVDLFRRLMEREQALAELKMYVKMLEEKMAAPPVVAAPAKPLEVPPPAPPPRVAPPPQARTSRTAPMPPQFAHVRPRVDGWKTW